MVALAVLPTELPPSTPLSRKECPLEQPQLRRSNSINRHRKSILKRNPSTKSDRPGKSITFAHSIEMICHFLKSESPLNIAKIDPLYIQDSGDVGLKSLSSSLLIPEFWSISRRGVITRPDSFYNVLLDECTLKDNLFTVSILAKNLAYEKSVTVRLTLDGWKSFVDLPAKFKSVISPTTEHYIGLDRFTVEYDLSAIAGEVLTIDFAIRFYCNGREFWDNNHGENYHYEFERKALAHSKSYMNTKLDPVDRNGELYLPRCHSAPSLKSKISYGGIRRSATI